MPQLAIVPPQKEKTPKKKKPQTSETKPVKVALKTKGAVYEALGQFLGHEIAAKIALYVLSITLGAFFPLTGYMSAHSGISLAWHSAPAMCLTVFCLLFSLPTALQFGKVAFTGKKVWGSALGLELAMLTAAPFYARWALGLLVVVNVLSTYYNLSTGKKFGEAIE